MSYRVTYVYAYDKNDGGSGGPRASATGIAEERGQRRDDRGWILKDAVEAVAWYRRDDVRRRGTQLRTDHA
jgi:hypothetical protein